MVHVCMAVYMYTHTHTHIRVYIYTRIYTHPIIMFYTYIFYNFILCIVKFTYIHILHIYFIVYNSDWSPASSQLLNPFLCKEAILFPKEKKHTERPRSRKWWKSQRRGEYHHRWPHCPAAPVPRDGAAGAEAWSAHTAPGSPHRHREPQLTRFPTEEDGNGWETHRARSK